MISYNIEQAMGDTNWNILTVATHQFGSDVQKAIMVDWACEFHYEQTMSCKINLSVFSTESRPSAIRSRKNKEIAVVIRR